MSYHVYTTESLILKGHSSREADGDFAILTSDMGVIRANAKGVRLVQSKLAPALLDASYSVLSLVRGKNTWRIIGGAPVQNTARFSEEQFQAKVVWFHFLHTLRFLINGEEREHKLLPLALSFRESLGRRSFSREELSALECLGIFHLMCELGYAHERPEYQAFLGDNLFSDESIQAAMKVRSLLVNDLNRALAASQS